MIRIKIGRDKEDLEKAILPAIIYAKKECVYLIAIGWWDFSIKITYIKDDNINEQNSNTQ